MFPSFSIHKDLNTDTIEIPVKQIELTFTGPYTVTVTANFLKMGKYFVLEIPPFTGTASGSITFFSATLPQGISGPSFGVGQSCILTNNGINQLGDIAVVGTSTIIIRTVPFASFTGICGAFGICISWISLS